MSHLEVKPNLFHVIVGHLIKEIEMKIKEITEASANVNPGYKASKAEYTLADYGRRLMDISAKMPMGKGVSDAEVDRSNKMSRLGDELTAYGTAFGAKNLNDLIKKTGLSKEEIASMLDLAKKHGPVELKGDDVPDEPEDDEKF